MPHCPVSLSTVQLLGGGCNISTPPPASSLFPLSTQHLKQTRNRVFGTHRLRGDHESNVAFQHVTECSRCNYTLNFLSTRKIGKTTWENDNRPLKRLPSGDRCFPGKTQALGSKACLPRTNIPRPSPLQHAHSSCPRVTSPSQHPRTAGCTAGSPTRRRGGKRLSHPRIAHPGSRRNSPRAPAPMTAGTEDGEHAGLRAFQAWPLRITRGQPKITACLVTLRGQAGSGLPWASLL